MSRFHHFIPPRQEDFDTEEEYFESVSAWESAEDDYADDYMERNHE